MLSGPAWRAEQRTAARGRHVFRWLLAALLLAAPGAADAADKAEGWPELNTFVRLDDRARLHFVTAYAMGKEAPGHTVDLAGYVDLSLIPILRPVRRQEDWARNRYLWLRAGYTHVFEAEQGDRFPAEDRGVLALYAKEVLPGDVWVEGRVRADLRWIDGDYSTRYRFRAEVNREFAALRRPLTPYLQAEAFYDTRYDDWSRVLLQAGAEVTFSRAFRVEVYGARQQDDLPSESTLAAVGLVAKLYF